MNPIALKLGPINIYWYSIFITIAFVIGIILALKEAKKQNISKDIMIDYFFYLIPSVLIGARLYYVLFNLDYYLSNPLDIIKVYEGGLAIHGGVIVGIIVTIIFFKKHKINFLKITDIMVVSLILGQAIGRWGNFINKEAFGPMASKAILKQLHIPNFIIDGMFIDGHYYQPTFFYESIWCLLGFIILLLIKKFKKTNLGELTSYYLVWYGIGRFMIESLRTDSLMFMGFKIAQIVSIIFIILGVIVFEYSLRKGNSNE